LYCRLKRALSPFTKGGFYWSSLRENWLFEIACPVSGSGVILGEISLKKFLEELLAKETIEEFCRRRGRDTINICIIVNEMFTT
jgi:hypothetical protein